MAGLNDAVAKAQAWEASRPSGAELYMRENDVVLFWFAGNGHPGDPYFEVYVAHDMPPSGQRKFGSPRYCPRLSEIQDGGTCPNPCSLEGYKTKQRMRMWLYVSSILHAQRKPDDPADWQQVDFMGTIYWQQKVEAPMIWDTSAWRESCLPDIKWSWQAGQAQGLHHNLHVLRTSGEGTAKRYRVTEYPISKVPFPHQAIIAEKCRPIAEALKLESTLEMVQPGASAPASIGAAAPALPSFVPQTVAPAPPPAFATAAPAQQPAFAAPTPPQPAFAAPPPPQAFATAAPAPAVVAEPAPAFAAAPAAPVAPAPPAPAPVVTPPVAPPAPVAAPPADSIAPAGWAPQPAAAPAPVAEQPAPPLPPLPAASPLPAVAPSPAGLL